MGKVILLAREENGRLGQEHFTGNQGVGWLKEGQRSMSEAKSYKAGMLMP